MALIIDANMPACCGGCFFLDYDTNERPRCFLCGADITKNVREQTKLPICPIIGEIPDSHGDLVDITPIRDKMSRIMNRYDIDDWGGKLADLIENAETIVEATE